MKSKEKKQLVGKSLTELAADVKKIRSEIASLYLDKIAGKLKNTTSLRNKRRDIAIIQTVMKIKEMNNQPSA